MFSRLGKFVARHWLVVILGWVVLTAGLKHYAPAWDDVTFDGDLAHLPTEMASIQGAKLLDRAFPDDKAKSQVVLVVTREGERLRRNDRKFAGFLADGMAEMEIGEGQEIIDILTTRDEVIGDMLKSRDKRAQLIVLRMGSEFMATANIDLLARVAAQRDKLIAEYAEKLNAEGDSGDEGVAWRAGLNVGITGSAAIGGDMLSAAQESIKNTEVATVILVVVILLFVYRAPLLVLIPLISIGVSVAVATSLVAWLTQLGPAMEWTWWDFKIFKTTKIFVVVILFGAGTDYCLFLVARYKEELAKGKSHSLAAADALANVGDALGASALTTIVGLSMMFFAAFGKYTSSGPAIALCLTVALAACVTLAPALLRAFGKILFWPLGEERVIGSAEHHEADEDGGGGFWDRMSGVVMARPGLILTVALLVMAPLAYVGTSVDITYDFLGELDRSRESVRGTALLRQHFPAGETGPVTIVASKAGARFKDNEGKNEILELVSDLYDVEGVVSIRSLATVSGEKPGAKGLGDFLKNKVAGAYTEAKEAFVSNVPEYDQQVTRLSVVLDQDPFKAEAIDRLNALIAKLDSLTVDPDSAWAGATFLCVGTTAGIRDLKAVTESDRTVILK